MFDNDAISCWQSPLTFKDTLFTIRFEATEREILIIFIAVFLFIWNLDEIWLKYFEFHIWWSLSSVDFHTLTLQLPIQTPNSVAPELQVFVSSLAISAKRAHPCPLN